MGKRDGDEFCRCHKPVREETLPALPEPQLDGAGNVVAVLCMRCTRIISCECPRCHETPPRMFDHVETCKPAPEKRARPASTADEWLPGVRR